MPCNSQQTYTYMYINVELNITSRALNRSELAVKILFLVSSCLICL